MNDLSNSALGQACLSGSVPLTKLLVENGAVICKDHANSQQNVIKLVQRCGGGPEILRYLLQVHHTLYLVFAITGNIYVS